MNYIAALSNKRDLVLVPLTTHAMTTWGYPLIKILSIPSIHANSLRPRPLTPMHTRLRAPLQPQQIQRPHHHRILFRQPQQIHQHPTIQLLPNLIPPSLIRRQKLTIPEIPEYSLRHLQLSIRQRRHIQRRHQSRFSTQQPNILAQATRPPPPNNSQWQTPTKQPQQHGPHSSQFQPCVP